MEFPKKHRADIADMWKKVLWSDKNQHCSSLSQHHRNWQARWWQHHVTGTLLFGRDWEACQDKKENGWCTVQVNP
ncbi:hypothetical protein FKM82_027738 [Ascaphus truei]